MVSKDPKLRKFSKFKEIEYLRDKLQEAGVGEARVIPVSGQED